MSLLLQVMASKKKIYLVLEFVNGGELFDKIVSDENHYNHLFVLMDRTLYLSRENIQKCQVAIFHPSHLNWMLLHSAIVDD